MKIVIDIPEEVYKSIQDNDYCGILNSDMYNAVKNGTPLPNNHGRLIDADELLKAIDTWDKFGVDDTGHLFRLDNLSLPHYVPYTHYDDMVESISGAETIIEAEKTTINHEKTTITDGDLISRDKALELVNYALAENKDVLEVLENMPSAEKTDSFIPQEDVAGILNTVESALKGTNYEVVGYDNTDGFLKVLIDVK